MARKKRQPTRPKRAAASEAYAVTVSSRKLVRTLLIAALLLLALHTVLYLYHFQVDNLSWVILQLFDVDKENNLPSWYSGVVLALTSCLLWVCAHQKRRDRDWHGHWYALSIGFLLLSADEIAGVHESINSVIVMTWAIPGGIFAGVIGLAFIPFVLSLPKRTAVLFAVAGAAYLIGAVGMEIIGNDMVSRRLENTLGYKLTAMVEESFEMLGIVLFVHALLAYMRHPDPDALRASVKIG